MLKITIDDKCCAAEAGETVLQVARRNNLWIPTLCYHPAMEPYASCRLCLVEVGNGKGWQMVTACNYVVWHDLAVRLSSEAVVCARQGVMRLLLARAPDSAELQELAGRLGVHAADLPTVTVAEGHCILCGLCVRVCEERIGTAAISLSGRGVERKVSTPFAEPSEECILCGALRGGLSRRDDRAGDRPRGSRTSPLRHQGRGAPLCRLRRSIGGRTGAAGAEAARGGSRSRDPQGCGIVFAL